MSPASWTVLRGWLHATRARHAPIRDERGALSLEAVVFIAIVVTAAIAAAVILATKITDTANSIPTG